MKIEFDEAGALADSKPQAGERLVLTDEALAAELVNVFNEYDKGLPGSQFGKLWIKTARRARELLAPQFAEQVADAMRRLGDDVAHCKERARKAEQALNSLRREGEYQMRSVDESDDPYDKGLRQGLLIALDAAGFTIVPAQPLKVIRHD